MLLAMVAALALASPDVSAHFRTQQHSEDDEAQLADVLRNIDAENLARAAAGQPRSRNDKAKIVRGAVNFFRPFPGGNGRSCATCHHPRDGFSLSPATVEARWQRLQRARRHNPGATDPLFRAIDADDGQDDFTLLRTRALVKVRVALPSRVRLTDDPTATHVTLSRAVTPLNMLKHTAPYQQDRSAATLEAQALGAVNQHMEPTMPPTMEFLESVAEFQRHIFSSAKVRKLSAAIDAGRPLPNLDPPLTELERLGKEKFDNFCGRCHGGPAQVQNLENRIFPPLRRLDEPGVDQHRGLEPAAERLSRRASSRVRDSICRPSGSAWTCPTGRASCSSRAIPAPSSPTPRRSKRSAETRSSTASTSRSCAASTRPLRTFTIIARRPSRRS